MVCELKFTSGSKKWCKDFMVIRHCVKELVAKTVLRGQEIHSSIGKQYNLSPPIRVHHLFSMLFVLNYYKGIPLVYI